MILGIFEIGVFAALAIWILLSNAGDLSLQPFNPNNAPEGAFTGSRQGHGLRDPRVHRLRGRRAARRRGEAPEEHDPPRGRLLVPRDRPLLRAALVRLGDRVGRCRHVRQAPARSGDPWRETREGVLGRRLGARVRRDHQLDHRQLERGLQRRHARLLCDGPKRDRTEGARAHAPGVQDTAHRDPRQPRDRRRALVHHGLEVGPAERVHHARDGRDGRRDHRLHAGDARVDPLLPDREARPVQRVPAHGLPARGDRAVRVPALLPVLPAPGLPVPVRRLVRARVDRRRADDRPRDVADAARSSESGRTDLRRGRGVRARTCPTCPRWRPTDGHDDLPPHRT